uniref:Fc mu receptor n=1 Tax=Equus asinus TaxID=9793 RepID=A0A8C4L6N4_EQUAS|nr:fas apoptotic inhibitory molecule 3 isoform X1 [Equus asinus]
MDLWLWSLCFLPVSGALKILPEVKLEGTLGGSVTIECPLPVTRVRLYLCRQMAGSGACATVVSNSNFVKKEYKHRVTLTPCPDRNLFLVEVTELTKSDSGVYACGAGTNTDLGKTQQITLNVNSEYELLWEEESMPELPQWFRRFLNMPVPPWFQTPAHAFEFTTKVTTPAQRTETPLAHHSSPTTLITHRPRVSRASSVAAAKPTTPRPSTAASKTSALRRQTASYTHHNRLHRQRGFHRGLGSGTEEQGFHILIPTILGLILLALLGLLVKRVIQRRKALSRRVRRLAVRMRARDASQRPLSQRPRVSPRPRSQNNIYSACPRRARAADQAGDGKAPLSDPGASAASAPPKVSEAPWPQASSLKSSCEYVSVCRQPAAMMEDTGLEDYVNIACLTHLSSCRPGPRPLCH